MKRVIDLNFLRDETLRTYYQAGNVGLFFDFHFMEMSKGNSIDNMRRSLKITSDYPGQVTMLKDLREMIVLTNGQIPFEQLDLAFAAANQNFPGFLRHIYSADAESDQNLGELFRDSSAYFTERITDATQVMETIVAFKKALSPSQLSSLRAEQSLSGELRTMIFGLAGQLSKTMIDSADYGIDASELILRYSIFGYLLVCYWCMIGGIESLPVAKMVNDITDLWYLAVGTFFDGLLTKERKLEWLMEEFGEVYRQHAGGP